MKETKENKCPYCENVNVRNSGSKIGDPQKMNPGDDYEEPKHPRMNCENCHKSFVKRLP